MNFVRSRLFEVRSFFEIMPRNGYGSQHGLTFMTEPVINGTSPFMVDYTLTHPIYCKRASMHALLMKRKCKNSNIVCSSSGVRNGCLLTMQTCKAMVIGFSLKSFGSVLSFCRWRKPGAVGLGIASSTATNLCGRALGVAFTFSSRLGYYVTFWIGQLDRRLCVRESPRISR